MKNINIKQWLIGYFRQYKKDGIEKYANGLKVDDIVTWLEKQGEKEPVKKEFTFKAIPRLLEMVKPTKRAKNYANKLADNLESSGYAVDAKIVREHIKIMNGEKVAMATMDEYIEQTNKQNKTVYACDTCPHKGNLICCHNCLISKNNSVMKWMYYQ